MHCRHVVSCIIWLFFHSHNIYSICSSYVLLGIYSKWIASLFFFLLSSMSIHHQQRFRFSLSLSLSPSHAPHQITLGAARHIAVAVSFLVFFFPEIPAYSRGSLLTLYFRFAILALLLYRLFLSLFDSSFFAYCLFIYLPHPLPQ